MNGKILAFLGIGLLIACTPTIDKRGYLGDPDIEASIKPGTDTKTTIQERLGYASTTASFGNETWYYISSNEKQVAFFTPTVRVSSLSRRRLVAVLSDSVIMSHARSAIVGGPGSDTMNGCVAAGRRRAVTCPGFQQSRQQIRSMCRRARP